MARLSAQIKVATYNQMFAFDGTSFWRSISSHFFLLGMKNLQKAMRKGNLERTFQMITKADADILGISEVLGWQQEQELRKFLKKSGYISIYAEEGHRLEKVKVSGINIIASKFTAEIKPLPKFSNQLNHGSGNIRIYIPEIDLDVLQVHLALPVGKMKAAFQAQTEAFQQLLQTNFRAARTLVMGDFNSTCETLFLSMPELRSFLRFSPGEPTCSFTPFFRLLFFKNVDHIFGKGLELIQSGLKRGHSDHALVWAKMQ